MKFVPYLRILWAITIVTNFLLRDTIVSGSEQGRLLIQGLTIFVVGTFVLYCVLMAIQEITSNQFINARFFNVFGLFFEVVIFIVTLYMLKIAGGVLEPVNLALVIVWQLGMLILIIVDVRKFFVSASPAREDET